MKYLLDTNICIYLIRERSKPLLEKIIANSSEGLGLSVITVCELEFGVAKSNAKEKNRLALDRFINKFSVLPLSEKAAKTYGELRAGLEVNGTPIGPLDLLIAAHALAENLTLVTNNEYEFKRVTGLRVENWT
ncbi:MAG TPA: VapC toxin family PIN domain ribonuclease [Cytophagales bacterium]|nr:VapC toxin family PIN domain ribonuclease [Cytophagales bacterium]